MWNSVYYYNYYLLIFRCWKRFVRFLVLFVRLFVFFRLPFVRTLEAVVRAGTAAAAAAAAAATAAEYNEKPYQFSSVQLLRTTDPEEQQQQQQQQNSLHECVMTFQCTCIGVGNIGDTRISDDNRGK